MPNTFLIVASHPNDYPGWNDRLAPWLVGGGLLLVALVLGYINFQLARPFRTESTTILPPDASLDQLQTRFARDGWQLGFRDSARLVMSIQSDASIASTAAIGCLSVWVALLHFLSSRKRITVEIEVDAIAGGTRVVTHGSRSGSNALRYVTTRLNELPKS